MFLKVLVVLLYLVSPLVAVEPKKLTGKWLTDQGLYLTINSAMSGQLTGIYQVARGLDIQEYSLIGSYDTKEDGNTLGWTISWSSPLHGTSHSVSAWAGKYIPERGEDPAVISATWIHTSDSKPENEWQATAIGKTDFLSFDEREHPEPSIP